MRTRRRHAAACAFVVAAWGAACGNGATYLTGVTTDAGPPFCSDCSNTCCAEAPPRCCTGMSCSHDDSTCVKSSCFECAGACCALAGNASLCCTDSACSSSPVACGSISDASDCLDCGNACCSTSTGCCVGTCDAKC